MSRQLSDPRPDPYKVLGVHPDATQADIAAAYRRLVRTLHPDRRNPDPDRLAAVFDAYNLLRDPHRRAAYDHQHRPTYRATSIPVRVRRHQPRPQPDLRAGPVRYHPPQP